MGRISLLKGRSHFLYDQHVLGGCLRALCQFRSGSPERRPEHLGFVLPPVCAQNGKLRFRQPSDELDAD